MNLITNITNLGQKHKNLAPLIIILIALPFFIFLQWSKYLPDPDSFYHIKIAQMMAKGGIIHNFPWLQFTVLKNTYIDHHLLYHALMAPFVTLINPFVGVKAFQIIIVIAFLLVFYAVLKKLKINGALFFTISLLLSQAFVFRMTLVKATPLSLIILFIGIYLITQKKYLLLALLSFIYVWTYGGWIFLPVATIIYILADGLNCLLENNQINPQKIFKQIPSLLKTFFQKFFSLPNIYLLFSSLSGIIAGIIINPYFPKNIYFYLITTFKIPFIVGDQISLGQEWYSFAGTDFLRSMIFCLILFSTSLALTLIYRPKLKTKGLFLFLITVLFLIATLKSKRNIEYLVPLMTLASAFLFNLIVKTDKFLEDLRLFKIFILPYININLSALMLFFAFFSSLIMIAINTQPPAGSNRYDRLEKASQFLSDNTSPGDVIYHSCWDEFPLLFYYNDKDYYISGLDPTFMYLYDKDLYQNMESLTLGKESAQSHNIIKWKFKAKYVLVVPKWNKFIKALNSDPRFQKVYSDRDAQIYKVL